MGSACQPLGSFSWRAHVQFTLGFCFNRDVRARVTFSLGSSRHSSLPPRIMVRRMKARSTPERKNERQKSGCPGELSFSYRLLFPASGDATARRLNRTLIKSRVIRASPVFLLSIYAFIKPNVSQLFSGRDTPCSPSPPLATAAAAAAGAPTARRGAAAVNSFA